MVILRKSKKIFWTNHAKDKMRFYKLSEQRILRILNSPSRIEEGIAPNTIAMMQSAGSVKHPHEIWMMIQETKSAERLFQRGNIPVKPSRATPCPKRF